jgi:hypothetical protein
MSNTKIAISNFQKLDQGCMKGTFDATLPNGTVLRGVRLAWHRIPVDFQGKTVNLSLNHWFLSLPRHEPFVNKKGRSTFTQVLGRIIKALRVDGYLEEPETRKMKEVW